MKKVVAIFLCIAVAVSFAGCASKGDGSVEKSVEKQNSIESLEEKIKSLTAEMAASKTEIEDLKSENASLTAKNEELQSAVDAKEAETTVQEDDVAVVLTGKSEASDEYGFPIANFVFSVKNNTDKAIKGVQGVATFKDLFDVDILLMKCDFTGISIEPASSVSVDDLFFDCNKFMDDHMKLYNTAFGDLKFEYKVTSIVFADGTTKAV